ncbi:hypothetical protein GOV06_01250 [Candidatus Woesearchaeota archaeon]|nr:hypothetical protein [Candidatus Woesearchaeota archaeon]
MKLKILMIVLTVLMIISSANAAVLEDFPTMFLKDVRVVVGRAASAEDVIGAVDIMAALQQRAGKSIRLGGAVLDTELEDLEAQNTIIVGGPCINSAAAKVMGYPENCLEGFEMGKGIIKLYEFDNGNIALLAAGTTALDTRRVTTVLAKYDEFALSGTEMVVTGVSISDTNIALK